MRLLWRDSWLETPKPHPVPGSTLIEVEATVPVAPLGAAHGRSIGTPVRKVASFTFTDGIAATLRKTRAKQAESGYTGDYHLVAILGHAEGASGPGRVVALTPRSPRCANWLLAHPALTRPVPAEFGVDDLRATAAELLTRSFELAPTLSQSYLYSGMHPPRRLIAAFERAVESPIPLPGAAPEALRPPPATAAPAARRPHADRPPLAILGAGDYVRIEVAPALDGADLDWAVLCDREPQIAALAAEELGFDSAVTDAAEAIDSLERRGLVIVATAHDSHAELTAHALEAGHRVICEKPAIVNAADLKRLKAAAARAPGELEVGFNRRYNPLVERVRRAVAEQRGPATIIASVREIDIAPDHWYLWPNQGTRVAGNLCHWIDLALHLLGPGPEPVSVSVSPRVSHEATGIDAERAFSIGFDDGSSVFLLPTGRGDSVRGVQEQIEVRRGSLTVRLDDLWRIRGLRLGRPIASRTLWRDKGHGRMYESMLRRFAAGLPATYPERDLQRVSEIQLAATELLLAEAPNGSVSDLLERSGERVAATSG